MGRRWQLEALAIATVVMLFFELAYPI